jgi:hypothetical protein
MKFEQIELETDERIVTIVRRHWFYLFIQSVPLVCVALLPLLFFFFIQQFDAFLSSLKTLHLQGLYLYCVWLLGVWLILVSLWTDFYLDIWCVTNKRIVKIDQVALFRRKTGSFRLERMQDVNVEINGILATLLSYGTIHVQTASADLEEFKASYLPNPQAIKAVILESADQLLSTKQGPGAV